MTQYGNTPVQDFYGQPGPSPSGPHGQPNDPLPYVPYGRVRRHWVSTLIVGLIVLFWLIPAAVDGGFPGILVVLGVAGFFTGIYVAATGRKSWAHVPRGRRGGLILLAAAVVAFIIGVCTLAAAEPDATESNQTTTIVEPVQEPAPPAPAPEPEPAPPAPVPEPVYVAPEPEPAPPAPEPVYEAPAPAAPPVYYQNCAAVKAAGAAPIHVGEPGWDPKFDKDGDGTGCELKK